MQTTIIACKTIEKELLAAIEKNGVMYPVLWLESGLHNSPKKLKARLTELLETVTEGRVLLAMGSCGNSLDGVVSEHTQLIVPRVDDCISILLGSLQQRQKMSSELAAYFLTEGWMRGERNLWVEHLKMVEKYGEEQAMVIAEMLYGHYRTLALVDCGTSSMDELLEESLEMAKTMSLEQKIVPGTLSYLQQLLTGPWPEDRFAVKEPGEALSMYDFLSL